MIKRETINADDGLSGGEADPARGSEADPEARETAGTARDGNAVERSEIQPGFLHHGEDQRYQALILSTAHVFSPHGEYAPISPHAGATALSGAVEGEDAHYKRACRTSFTSGM